MVVFGAIQNNNGACFAVLPRRRPENFRIGRGVEAGKGGGGGLVNKTVGRVEVRKRDRPLGNLSNV